MMEKIFKFLECTKHEKITCVTYQLRGLVDYWWDSLQKTMTIEQLQNYTWEEVKEELFMKFNQLNFSLRKETEFHNLCQGKLLVIEYDRVFCELSRYTPKQVETYEKKAGRFCVGLRMR